MNDSKIDLEYSGSLLQTRLANIAYINSVNKEKLIYSELVLEMYSPYVALTGLYDGSGLSPGLLGYEMPALRA